MNMLAISCVIDPESLGDIPADDFARVLVDHLHAQWPGAAITTRLAPTTRSFTVTLDDPLVDPAPYEQRAKEYAEDVFTLFLGRDR